MPKRTIEEIVQAKYDDPDVAQHVLESVQTHNTADRILSGELVLPSVDDATRNHQIATGTFATTENEKVLRDQNQMLKDRLDSLEQTVGTMKKGK